jgi:hypothetical protein
MMENNLDVHNKYEMYSEVVDSMNKIELLTEQLLIHN